MMTNLSKKITVLGLLLFSLVATASEKNNVVFVLVDDLNDYIEPLAGHPQVRTPNLDRLASQAANFSHAYANVPVCSPSRNSLFTGVYPHRSKDFGWTRLDHHPVLKHHKTFLQLFKENGYEMLGTGKLLHTNIPSLWHRWGVKQRLNYGPHAFDGTNIVGHPSVRQPFRDINIVDGSFAPLSDVPKFSPNQTTVRTPGWGYPKDTFVFISEQERDLLPDEAHAQWAKKQIERRAKEPSNAPFFLGVGLVRPHTPLYAPSRFFDMYPLDSIVLPKLLPNDLDDTHLVANLSKDTLGQRYYRALVEAYGQENGLKRIIQAYLACISFMDEQLGVILDAIEHSPFADNTAIVFTSDHGWQFGEKDYLYKNSPWEESNRIPLIIKIPNLTQAGKFIDQPVSLIDIFPTFVDVFELAGTHKISELAGNIDGASLRPLLDGRSSTQWQGPEGALSMLGASITQPVEGVGIRFNKQTPWHIKIIKDLDDSQKDNQIYSYRTRDWRYVRYPDQSEELYHHKNDPNEWHNLAGRLEFTDQLIHHRNAVAKIVSTRSNNNKD